MQCRYLEDVSRMGYTSAPEEPSGGRGQDGPEKLQLVGAKLLTEPQQRNQAHEQQNNPQGVKGRTWTKKSPGLKSQLYLRFSVPTGAHQLASLSLSLLI